MEPKYAVLVCPHLFQLDRICVKIKMFGLKLRQEPLSLPQNDCQSLMDRWNVSVCVTIQQPICYNGLRHDSIIRD